MPPTNSEKPLDEEIGRLKRKSSHKLMVQINNLTIISFHHHALPTPCDSTINFTFKFN